MIAFCFAVWILAGYFAVNTSNIVIDILCYIAGGIGLNALSVLAHEGIHGNFTRNNLVDRVIASVCGLPILFATEGYCVTHLEHHAKLRTESDPDDIENITKNPKKLAVIYVLLFFLSAYAYLFSVPVRALRIASSRERVAIAMQCVIIMTVITLAWVFLPTNVMIEAWLVPMIIGAQIVSLLSVSQHGMTSTGNEFIDSRTIISNRIVSFLICNVNYHIEHHLYRGVPWYNLPKLHKLLVREYERAGSTVYRSFLAFYFDFFKALKSGVVPAKRLVSDYIKEKVCL